MKRLKRYNDLYETNGPAYGKQETTKRGLKGIPMTTDNPTIIDPNISKVNNDNDGELSMEEEEPKPVIGDDGTRISEEEMSIVMDAPKVVMDRRKMKTRNKTMKRIKTFEQMNENIGPALDGEYATNIEDIKKQGEPLRDDKIIDLDSDVYQDQSKDGKTSFEVYYTDKNDKEGTVIVWVDDVDDVEDYFEEIFPQFTLYDIGEVEDEEIK